jgi:hypothetical protein
MPGNRSRNFRFRLQIIARKHHPAAHGYKWQADTENFQNKSSDRNNPEGAALVEIPIIHRPLGVEEYAMDLKAGKSGEEIQAISRALQHAAHRGEAA